jgi:hypothetical protein
METTAMRFLLVDHDVTCAWLSIAEVSAVL